VNYGSLSGSQAPLWVAKEAGLFEKHGLDVNLVFISSSFKPVMALMSGSTQFMNLSSLPSLEAYLRGADTVLLASTSNTVEHHLMVQPTITNVKELPGKVLGIGSLGSLIDVVLREALRLSGISDQAVTILPVGNEVARVTSLQNGKINGTTVTGAYTLLLRQAGYRSLLDFSKLPIHVATSSIMSTRSFVSKNRTTTNKFLRAWVEGIFAFRANEELGRGILKKYTRIDNSAIIEAIYKHYRNLNTTTAKPSIPVVRSSHKLLSTMRPEMAGMNPDGFADLSFFQELETSGFLEQMNRQYAAGKE
jgi:NitT/TauT family transport system substrate-binding protein